MITIQQLSEKVSCLCRKVEVLRSQNRIASPSTDNYAIAKNEGVVIIPTAAANTRNVWLPDPKVNTGRRITIANYSGAAQGIFSHDGGNEETIKSTSGALVSTLSIADSAAASTAASRYTFLSDGTRWFIIAN